jgi:4a-hydroxytetrahydrobiopterin dehydratase
MGTPEHWSQVDGALERRFEFNDFPQAVAFVNRVAELAQAADHHPDIEIHYRHVTLRWSTHSAGGVTDRDRELAAQVDTLA